MLDNPSFFLYKEKKNLIKKLNPINVTFLLFLISITILLNENLFLVGIFFLGGIILGLFCGEKVKNTFKLLFHTKYFLILVFLYFVFIKNSLGEFSLYFFKVYSLLLLSRLYITNMKNSLVEISFTYLLSPLCMFRINCVKVAKTLALSLSFLSLIYKEALKTWKAIQSRGLSLQKVSFFKKVKWMYIFLVPLFRKTEIIADQVAETLVVKGFNSPYQEKEEIGVFSMMDSLILISFLYLFLYVVLKRVISFALFDVVFL